MSRFLSMKLIIYYNGYASENLNVESYPAHPQTSKMERFVTTAKGFEPLTIVAKHSTLYVLGKYQFRETKSSSIINIWKLFLFMATCYLQPAKGGWIP